MSTPENKQNTLYLPGSHGINKALLTPYRRLGLPKTAKPKNIETLFAKSPNTEEVKSPSKQHVKTKGETNSNSSTKLTRIGSIALSRKFKRPNDDDKSENEKTDKAIHDSERKRKHDISKDATETKRIKNSLKENHADTKEAGTPLPLNELDKQQNEAEKTIKKTDSKHSKRKQTNSDFHKSDIDLFDTDTNTTNCLDINTVEPQKKSKTANKVDKIDCLQKDVESNVKSPKIKDVDAEKKLKRVDKVAKNDILKKADTSTKVKVLNVSEADLQNKLKKVEKKEKSKIKTNNSNSKVKQRENNQSMDLEFNEISSNCDKYNSKSNAENASYKVDKPLSKELKIVLKRIDSDEDMKSQKSVEKKTDKSAEKSKKKSNIMSEKDCNNSRQSSILLRMDFKDVKKPVDSSPKYKEKYLLQDKTRIVQKVKPIDIHEEKQPERCSEIISLKPEKVIEKVKEEPSQKIQIISKHERMDADHKSQQLKGNDKSSNSTQAVSKASKNPFKNRLSLKKTSSNGSMKDSDDEFFVLSSMFNKNKLVRNDSCGSMSSMSSNDGETLSELRDKVYELSERVGEKEKKLNHLKQSEIYKKIHNVADLEKETLRWKNVGIEALQELLIAANRTDKVTLPDLLKKLNVPDRMIRYDSDNDTLL